MKNNAITDAEKQRNIAHTRELVLNPNRPKYTSGPNWLGHGVRRGGKDAFIDELLLEGAPMSQFLQFRRTAQAIKNHFRHLRLNRGLEIEEVNGKHQFSRAQLGLDYTLGHNSDDELTKIAARVNRTGYFLTKTWPKERKRVLREIVERRGQPEFRQRLIDAYGGKCAATGCDAIPALEAAHIRPYAKFGSDDVANGILFRADIHTLFDLGFLGVHPETLKISLAPHLKQSHYADLDDKRLGKTILPADRPDEMSLQERWKRFCT